MINADHHLRHHIFFIGLALSDHQRQYHQRIVRQLTGTVWPVKDMILLQEPDKEKGDNALVAIRKRMIFDHEVQEISHLLFGRHL